MVEGIQHFTTGWKAKKLVKGKKYIWAIDESGNLRIGEEISVGVGRRQRLGHPTLVPDDGLARVGGEIKLPDKSNQWRINDESGRFSTSRSKEERANILTNVQTLFKEAGLDVGVRF